MSSEPIKFLFALYWYYNPCISFILSWCVREIFISCQLSMLSLSLIPVPQNRVHRTTPALLKICFKDCKGFQTASPLIWYHGDFHVSIFWCTGMARWLHSQQHSQGKSIRPLRHCAPQQTWQSKPNQSYLGTNTNPCISRQLTWLSSHFDWKKSAVRTNLTKKTED